MPVRKCYSWLLVTPYHTIQSPFVQLMPIAGPFFSVSMVGLWSLYMYMYVLCVVSLALVLFASFTAYSFTFFSVCS